MTIKNNSTPQYLHQYGLKVAPFRLSPDPQFFFPAQTHLAAEKILQHAIGSGEGFMVLTGQAGLGKTLLLRRLLENFDEQKIPILILSPTVDPKGLLQLLLGEMNIAYQPEDSLANLLQLFQNRVLQLAEQQQELFIIIDEAQNMQVPTLEQLRMLSNLETGSRKLMQILLIGQTELEEVLKNPGLGQLVQRIVVHEKLEPLNRQQISQYVHYRLGKAGRGDICLTRGAGKVLAVGSQGVPRLINRIMDRSLLLASVNQATVLTKKHVQNGISTMKDIQALRQVNVKRKVRGAVGATVVAAALLAFVFFRSPLIEAGPDFFSSFLSMIQHETASR